MRELTSHMVTGLNEALRIQALDERDKGNICHIYEIKPAGQTNYEAACTVRFQKGAVKEVGINGVTNEALLAMIEDRLLGLESSQFASRENAIALMHVQNAMMWLHKRARDRVARGVDGTNQK